MNVNWQKARKTIFAFILSVACALSTLNMGVVSAFATEPPTAETVTAAETQEGTDVQAVSVNAEAQEALSSDRSADTEAVEAEQEPAAEAQQAEVAEPEQGTEQTVAAELNQQTEQIADVETEQEASADMEQEDLSEEDPAAVEEIEYPAFQQEKIVDGVKITVIAGGGVFPEGATLSVEKVSSREEKKVDEAVEEVRDSERIVAASYTFDIKVLDKDGNEVQPADDQTVQVSFTTQEVTEDLLTTEVYHIEEDGKDLTAEKLEVAENGDTAVAETDGFSTYTIMFSYNGITYNMTEDSITLDTLMSEIKLNGKIYNVKSSNSAVLAVKGPEGAPTESNASEWTLTARGNGDDENPVELLISLYERPDFRVSVTYSGSPSKHEIKFLHEDGHEVTASNPARSCEIIQVYVTGYSDEDQAKLKYAYSTSGQGVQFYNTTFSGNPHNANTTTGTVGDRFFVTTQGKRDSCTTFFSSIKVYDGTTEVASLSNVSFHFDGASLAKDMTDLGRSFSPLVLHVGDEVTEDQLKTALEAAGLAHPTCGPTTVRLDLTGKTILEETTTSGTYKAVKTGNELIRLNCHKEGCVYHYHQDGAFDLEVYVVDNVAVETNDQNDVTITGLNEYSQYQVVDEAGNVVKQFTFDTYTFRNLEKNMPYTVYSRTPAVPAVTTSKGVQMQPRTTNLTISGLDDNLEYRLYVDANRYAPWYKPTDGTITFTGLEPSTNYKLQSHNPAFPTNYVSVKSDTRNDRYRFKSAADKEYLLMSEDGSNVIEGWVQGTGSNLDFETGVVKNMDYRLYSRDYNANVGNQNRRAPSTVILTLRAESGREYKLSRYTDGRTPITTNDGVAVEDGWFKPADGKSSITFTDLPDNTTFYAFARVPEVLAGQSSSTNVTTGGELPASNEEDPVIYEVTNNSVTVKVVPGKEYSIDGENYQVPDSTVIEGLSGGKYKIIEIINGINFISTTDSQPKTVKTSTGSDLVTEVKSYDVKFDANGGTGTMPNQSIGIDKEQNLNANVYIRDGYAFTGWNTAANGSGTAYNDKASVKNLSTETGSTVTLYAQWAEAKKYDVTFDSDGGSEVEKQEVKDGEKATKPADPTKTGYTFAKWQLNGKDYDFETAVTGTIELKAVWTANTDTAYKVEHYKQDAVGSDQYTLTDTEDKTGTTDSDVTATEKTYEKFVLDNSNANTINSGKIAPDGSLILKLYYKIDADGDGTADDEQNYTITFNTAGGSQIDSITQTYGTEVTAPVDPTRDGYTFDGWDTEIPTKMPAENLTITAKWKVSGYQALTDDAKPTISIKRGDNDVDGNTPQIGDTLTADTTATGVTYKWFYADEDGNPTGEAIGTDNTYTVQSKDKDKKIVVVAMQTIGDDGNTLAEARSATSAATDAVTLKDGPTAPDSVNADVTDTKITVTEPVQEGDKYEYSLDGETWQGSNEFTVDPLTSYTLHVREKAPDADTNPGTETTMNVTTNATVAIEGQRVVGSELTATVTPAAGESETYTYKWYRGDEEISGATTSKYTPVDADKDKELTIKVFKDGKEIGSIKAGEISNHVHNYSYTLNDEKDTITATCNAHGNTAECTKTLKISAVGKEYDGHSVEAILSNDAFTADTGATVSNIDYYNGTTLITGAPVDAGDYTAKVTVTPDNGETVTAEIAFSITAKKLTSEEDLNKITVDFKADGDGTHVYDGTVWTPDTKNIVVKYDGKDVPFTAEFPAEAKDVRVDYPIKVSLTGNYAGTVKDNAGTYSITPAVLTITADAKSKFFGDADPELTYQSEGLVSDDAISGDLTRVSGENVGTYEIQQGTLSAGNNYEIKYTKADLTVNKLVISGKYTIDISVDPVSNVYTGLEIKPTVTVKLIPVGDTDASKIKIIDSSDYDLTYDPAEVINPGKYSITATLKGNYAAAFETKENAYAITKKPGPTAPTNDNIQKVTKDSAEPGVENGSIQIKDYDSSAAPMEYCQMIDGKEVWKPVPANGVIGNPADGAIDGLSAGTYKIRYAETGTTEASDAFEVVVPSKTTQEKPEGLDTTRLSSAEATDGSITGITAGKEYSKDNGQTWTKVTSEQAAAGKIDGLGAGTYQVRYAETPDASASEAVSLTVSAKDVLPQAEEKPNIVADGYDKIKVTNPESGYTYELKDKDEKVVATATVADDGSITVEPEGRAVKNGNDLVFTGLDPNKEFTVDVYKKATDDSHADSPRLTSEKVTTGLKPEETPDKPTVAANGKDSAVVSDAKAGNKYVVKAKDGNVVKEVTADADGDLTIDGLSPDTEYTVEAIKMSTDPDNRDSDASDSVIIKTAKTAPTGVEQDKKVGAAGNDGSIKGVDETMEYYDPEAKEWKPVKGDTITGLKEGEYKVRYAAVKDADGKEIQPASDPAPVTVEKKTSDQTALTKENVAVSKDQTSITVDKPVKSTEDPIVYEYRIDGGEWVTTTKFEGLKPGTTHLVEIRKAETSDSMPSDPVELSVTTTPEKISSDDIVTTTTTLTIKNPQPNIQYEVKDDKGDTVATITVGKDGTPTVNPEGKAEQDKDGNIVVKGLDPEKKYTVTATKTNDDGEPISEASEPAEATTLARVLEETPAQPSAEAKSDGSVEIKNAADGTQYIIKDADGTQVKVTIDADGNVTVDPEGEVTAKKDDNGNVIVEGLAPDKEYEITAVTTATSDDKTDSEPSDSIKVKTAKSAPTSPEMKDKVGEAGNDGSIKGMDDTMEYLDPESGEWKSVPEGQNEITGLGEGEYKVRYKAEDGQPESEPVTVKVEKKDSSQKAPESAPEAEADSTTSITVNPVMEDEEYSIDGGKTWVKPGEDDFVTFKDLTPGKEYEVISRKVETKDAMPSEPSPAKQVTTPKVDQSAPENAPAITETTSRSITVKAVAGEEYSIDNGKTWIQPKEDEDTVTFDGLTPGKDYEVVSRKTGSNTTNPSGASEPAKTTTPKEAQEAPASAPKIKEITASSVTVEANFDEEYSIDGGKTWMKPEDGKDTVTFDNLTPGKEYNVVSRKAETDTNEASDPSSSAQVNTLKADQEAPASAPKITETTPTSVTVNAVDGEEYSIDGGKTWVKPADGKAVFENLTPGTDYEVISRKAGDDTHNPSKASEAAKASTPKAEQDAPKKAPKITETAPTSITVEAKDGEEYSIDGGTTWIKPAEGDDTVTFGALTPGKEYAVVSRNASTDTQNASPASDPTSVSTPKKDQSAPDSAPSIKDITATSVTVEAKDGEEYSIDGGKTWIKPADGEDTVTFDDLKPGKNYSVVSRKAETDTENASESSVPAPVNTNKETQEAPTSAPKITETTPTSITVDAVDGEEYSIDGGKTWVKPADGKAVFEKLTPGTDYEVISRKAGDDTHNPSGASEASKASTPKADQDAPKKAPKITETTPTSITVDAVDGEEYSIDGGKTWVKPADGKDTVTFDDLTPGKDYKVVSRNAGTDTQNPSEASEPAETSTPKAGQDAPESAPSIKETTPTSITVNAKDGEEYSVDGGKTWIKPGDGEDTVTFDNLKPGKDYEVVSRKAETETNEASDSSAPAKVNTGKENQDAPETAPTVKETTSDSITVNAADGEEYSIDGGKTWISPADGENTVTFDNLKPGEDYEVVSRKAGDDTKNPSEPSKPAKVTTDKEDQEAPKDAPQVTADATSITVNPSDKDQEYVVVPAGTKPEDVDWTKAKAGNGGELTFDDLTPGKDYEVVSRKAGDDTKNPSEPSTPAKVTTGKEDQSAPEEIPSIKENTPTSITVDVKPGEEYSIDGGETWIAPKDGEDTVTFDGLEPGKDYEVVSRKAGDDTHNPSEPSAPATVNTGKHSQEAPESAPTVKETTSDSITVDAAEGEEYSIDGGKTWIKPEEGKDTVTFDGLEPGKDYEVISRKAGDDTKNPSEPSEPTKVNSGKETQEAPEKAPSVKETTPTSITVDAAAGEEYSIDGGKTWISPKDGEDTVTFDNLEPGKDYEVVSRKAGDDTKNPSEPSEPTKVNTGKEAQEAPEKAPSVKETTPTSITVDAAEGEEYSIDGGKTWVTPKDGDDTVTFDNLEPGKDYEVVSRKAGDDTKNPSEPSEPTKVNTGKEAQEAPEKAPSVKETTPTSITVDAAAGEEYSIDGGKTWVTPKDGEDTVTFDNLEPGKDYEVVSRKTGDDTKNPSEPSTPAKVTTNKETQEAPKDAPAVQETKSKSVTVNPTIAGQEYIVVPKGTTPTEADWAKAQTSKRGEAITFDSLVAGQDYEVITRKPADATHEPSAPSKVTEVTTPVGSLETEVDIEKDVPPATVKGLTTELAEELCDDDELQQIEDGAHARVYLEMTNIDDTVSRADKRLCEKALDKVAPNAVMGMYLDLSLYKQVGNAKAEKLTTTNDNMITVTLTIPTDMRPNSSNITRTFYVIRVHDGKTDILATTTAYVVTFQTSLFSTYGIAYSDELADQAAPEKAPTIKETTPTSIIVDAKDGEEYSIDGGKTWQKSGIFTGLTPGKEYQIIARKAGTDTQNPSDPSEPITVTTATEETKKIYNTNHKAPKTGDTANTDLWLRLMVLSTAGFVVLLSRLRKEKQEQN